MVEPLFRNRAEAGQVLAGKLQEYADRPDTIVLALPRGGVPVAFEVASRLRLPLDVFIVRKLGVPGHEELAMGAIASGGVRVINHDVVDPLGIPAYVLESAAARELVELSRREREYRGDLPPPDFKRKTIIIVDDGLATGSSMRAAVRALRAQEPRSLVIAVPTAAPETCAEMQAEADRVVCAFTP
ncbi:MAG: phosphoribosyltransferase, partial [Rudaea sp.]